MASAVGPTRHAPDPLSMLRQCDELQQVGADARTLLERASQLTDAYRNGMSFGRCEGFRDGFTRGTHWGMFCGAIAASAVVLVGLIGFVVWTGRSLPLGL